MLSLHLTLQYCSNICLVAFMCQMVSQIYLLLWKLIYLVDRNGTVDSHSYQSVKKECKKLKILAVSKVRFIWSRVCFFNTIGAKSASDIKIYKFHYAHSQKIDSKYQKVSLLIYNCAITLWLLLLANMVNHPSSGENMRRCNL